MDCIYPYVKSTAVFHCPDDPGWAESGQYVPASQLTAASNDYYGSYAINASYYGQCPRCGPGNNVGNSDTSTGMILSQLMQPSQTIWVSDGSTFQCDWSTGNPAPINALYAGTGYSIGSGFAGTTDDARNNGNMMEVHGGPDIVNVLWCDGHVKSMKISNLLTTNSSGDYGYFTMQGPS
jgi:prepilin-type processing-associated H-X9-DG protein